MQVLLVTATASNATNITYSLDAASLAAGNTIDAATGLVTFAAGWAGTTTITATATGCNSTDYAIHTVSTRGDVATPVFALGAGSTRCQNGNDVAYTATAANTTGITYSLDATSETAGNVIDVNTGVVSYFGGWSGTCIITASAAGCKGPAAANHTVTITHAVPILYSF